MVYVVFRYVNVDPSHHRVFSFLLVFLTDNHIFLISHTLFFESTCPQVGFSCYISYCMRVKLVIFITMDGFKIWYLWIFYGLVVYIFILLSSEW
jgi:hypothetical protein